MYVCRAPIRPLSRLPNLESDERPSQPWCTAAPPDGRRCWCPRSDCTGRSWRGCTSSWESCTRCRASSRGVCSATKRWERHRTHEFSYVHKITKWWENACVLCGFVRSSFGLLACVRSPFGIAWLPHRRICFSRLHAAGGRACVSRVKQSVACMRRGRCADHGVFHLSDNVPFRFWNHTRCGIVILSFESRSRGCAILCRLLPEHLVVVCLWAHDARAPECATTPVPGARRAMSARRPHTPLLLSTCI